MGREGGGRRGLRAAETVVPAPLLLPLLVLPEITESWLEVGGKLVMVVTLRGSCD